MDVDTLTYPVPLCDAAWEGAMAEIAWDIRREGRRWRPGELRERYEALPEMKFEIIDGQLPWDDGVLVRNVSPAAIRSDLGAR